MPPSTCLTFYFLESQRCSVYGNLLTTPGTPFLIKFSSPNFELPFWNIHVQIYHVSLAAGLVAAALILSATISVAEDETFNAYNQVYGEGVSNRRFTTGKNKASVVRGHTQTFADELNSKLLYAYSHRHTRPRWWQSDVHRSCARKCVLARLVLWCYSSMFVLIGVWALEWGSECRDSVKDNKVNFIFWRFFFHTIE